MRLSLWRYKKFHSAYLLGWLSCGLLAGLGSSLVYPIKFDWISLMLLVAVVGVAIVKARWYMVVVIIVAGTLIGNMRGSDVAFRVAPTRALAGKMVWLEGTIIEDPQPTARGDTKMMLGSLRGTDIQYEGTIWATTRGEKDYRRGDRLAIRGTMHEGFGVYQLSATYVDVIERVASHDPMLQLRDTFSSALRSHVIEPSASLGIGFVVGQKTSLPTSLEEQLRIIGLTHLVVASGYNLTILVRFAKRLFDKHSKFLVAFASSSLIVGFIAISGASPSMVRASIVAGLSIAAWYYGRRFHPLLLIVYVAALTAMLNPFYVWADVGWWLSFLAFIGVLVLAPLMMRLLLKKQSNQHNALLQLCVETIAAQIMTLPLILMIFGNLPVLALLANVVSAPLIPCAMLLTFVAGVVTMLVPVLGELVSLPAEVVLSYFVAVIRWLSKPEWAQIPVTISPAMMVAIYMGVATIMYYILRRTRFNFRAQSLVE